MEEIQLENTTEVIRCHSADVCSLMVCSIHNMTNHRMRDFPQHWRVDRRIMERICPHGVGHPDPDDYKFLLEKDSGVHGCDGCCSDWKFETDD